MVELVEEPKGIQMLQSAENLRYLLWRARIQRNEWPTQLAEWIECSESHAEDLLQVAELDEVELIRVCGVIGVDRNELQVVRFLERDGINVLLENLRYLFMSLEHGQKKLLAAQLGVRPLTISRWSSGEQRPSISHLSAICRYFELPYGTALETEPIFLALMPLSSTQLKEWVYKRIGGIEPAKFRRLFPILKILLEQ